MYQEVNYLPTSTCMPVKGFCRSIIYDLQRSCYDIVPNTLCDFLGTLKKDNLEKIYLNTSVDSKNILEEYVNYCIEKEYILAITKNINLISFPKLNLIYKTPSIITNICLELLSSVNSDFSKIKKIIQLTKCYNIQIIIDREYDLENLIEKLIYVSEIGLRSIELIIEYNSLNNYDTLIQNLKNISFVLIHSAPETKILKNHYFGIQQIFSSNKRFKIRLYKKTNEFNVNITLFTESQNHNTYYNKKLYIGPKGEIKNALEMNSVFGNIKELNHDDTILEIIEAPEFQKYWKVHKGLIDICKHCEFRHMCIDNRIPIKRNEKEWFFETECNYNPYIAKWQDEDGYKTIEECGIQSNANGFKLNRKKLNAINKVLWGDD